MPTTTTTATYVSGAAKSILQARSWASTTTAGSIEPESNKFWIGHGNGITVAASTDIALSSEYDDGSTSSGASARSEAATSATTSTGSPKFSNDTIEAKGTVVAKTSSTRLVNEAGLFYGKSWSTSTAATLEVSSLSGTAGTALTLKNAANLTSGTYYQIGAATAAATNTFNEAAEIIKLNSGGTSTTVYTVERGVNGSVAKTAASGEKLTLGAIGGPYLTGTTTVPASASGAEKSNIMFARANFGTVTLNAGDSIQYTWQIQFSQ